MVSAVDVVTIEAVVTEELRRMMQGYLADAAA